MNARDKFVSEITETLATILPLEWSPEELLSVVAQYIDKTWDEAREVGYSAGYNNGYDEGACEERGENVWPLR